MAALPDFRPPAPVERLVGANQALILNSDSVNADNTPQNPRDVPRLP